MAAEPVVFLMQRPNVQSMSEATPEEAEERFLPTLPVWVRIPIKAEAVLLVILVPTLYISSLEPGGILGLATGIASSTIVLMVVIAFVPILFALISLLRRGYGALKAAFGAATRR